ncbi:MAG: universal stress protein [Halodesulfurarchaeum sp.]
MDIIHLVSFMSIAEHLFAMERALFVAQYESPETKRLLREAGALAAGVDGELVILNVMAEEEYEERAESRREAGARNRSIRQLGGYPLTQASDDAKRLAERLGWHALDDLDLEWLAVGSVGDEVTEILSIAEDFECDHLFVVGKRRSPSGKAIFGDLAQRLVLKFDGPVTVLVPEEES